jgi:hypothetical protein
MSATLRERNYDMYLPAGLVTQRISGDQPVSIEFKGSHFERGVILWGVRWYVAYPIN